MVATKRCPFCGKMMQEKILNDGAKVLQCPRCLYTEQLPQTKEITN